jgi:protein HIRA/HIR1
MVLQKALHERMYGKYIQVPNSLASKTIVETSELLAVCEAQDKKQTAVPSKITFVNKQPNNLPASPIRGPSKQIETRTSDGKRRITPMYIPTVVDNGCVCFYFFPSLCNFNFSLHWQ